LERFLFRIQQHLHLLSLQPTFLSQHRDCFHVSCRRGDSWNSPKSCCFSGLLFMPHILLTST
jgi:hypothetical protein